MSYFDSKIVTTRQPHRCYGCRTKYLSGTLMEKGMSINDGEFWHGYHCLNCLMFLDVFYQGKIPLYKDYLNSPDVDDGLMSGEVQDMKFELWEETIMEQRKQNATK